MEEERQSLSLTAWLGWWVLRRGGSAPRKENSAQSAADEHAVEK